MTKDVKQPSPQHPADEHSENGAKEQGVADSILIRAETFRRMVDKLPQMIYEADLTGRLIYANEYALASFGYTRDAFNEGLTIADVIHPDDQYKVEQAFQEAVSGEVTKGHHYLGIRSDGSTLPIKVYSQGVFYAGQPVGICGVILDTTESVEIQRSLLDSENYYRTLFENTGTATCIIGEDGYIRSCNSQFETLAGCASSDIIRRMKWSDFVSPEDLPAMQEYQRKRTTFLKAPEDYDFTFIPKNGAPKHIHVFVKLIPGTTHSVCSLVDLTKQKKIEQELRKSEERYELVTRGANDGIWDWDIRTNDVFFSERYKNMLGYTEEEFPNTADSWLSHIHPDDDDKVMEANMRCVNGEVDQFEVEYRIRHKDGNYRWVLGRGASVRDENGTPYRLGGTHTDVTDRKEAEEQYRNIVENASDAIFRITADGSQFMNANTATATILGYSSSTDLLVSVTDISKDIYHDPSRHELLIEDLRTHGSVTNREIELRRRDGNRIWMTLSLRSIHDDFGQIKAFEGVAHDITSRKLSERTSRALYAISEAVSTSGDLRHLYKRIHAVLDETIDAPNFFISMLDEENDRIHFPYFVDEKDEYYDIRNVSAPDARGFSIHLLRTGEPLFLSRARPRDIQKSLELGVVGTPPAVWMGVPLKLKGKIVGTMTVQHYSDPTHYNENDMDLLKALSEQVVMAIERKANEEALTALNEELESKVAQRTAELERQKAELERTNKRLQELDQVKSALVSSVSHELRTPLTSIWGFAKLTGKEFARHFNVGIDDSLKRKKGNRILRNLGIIQSEGERLTRLINDFLDINRIESGKAQWNDTLLDTKQAVENATQAVEGAFAAKCDVTLISDIPTETPKIHADPDKIQQLLINLLNNACKFTMEGTVTVALKTAGDTITISITDTGMGIPKEEQAKIFEKFHKSRAGDTISIKDKGTGLGLAISREIVEHYGGAIWVESEPDEGSTFSFTLPCVKETDA